ncbi:MAG: Asp-tRNA(Asn)/Glu-tRNA(Gln) amidotransferase subunit GatC [Alphaproteobacteria bacterium]|nr:Asp-tRNA(Asn)/Glu-tRNA(Gln) amidotransferase subunit GatC [Alphaproteobacteria bacterium]
MSIDHETVVKVARLARIKLDEKDILAYEERLNRILDWISMLEEVDTQNVEPMFSVHLDHMPQVDDIVTEPSVVAAVLANAPEKELDMYVVPKVVG